MTDNMKAYEDALCKVANVDEIGEVSDGFHTFNQLYHQRAMLFAALVNLNRDISWKTRKHEDGQPCFGGGWFLVTIDTPDGAYGYHYEDKYWDLFHCKELERAKHWDGYTEEDVGRLMSLYEEEEAEWEDCIVRGSPSIRCSYCGHESVYEDRYCGGCGCKMKNGY